MGTQVSYPGIYVQEFTPGAPIQGVGTSTGAFIGTATMGPINQPIAITSWDEFQNLFGGFIADPSNTSILTRSWLAPAVYGFFLNGGTNCYIIRAVAPQGSSTTLPTSLMALYDLLDREASPKTALVATAIAEGTIGAAITVQVLDSSRLASMLQAAGSPATTLALAQAQSDIVSFDSTGTILTLASNSGFLAGDRIQLSNGLTVVTAVISSTQGTAVVGLLAPVPPLTVASLIAGGTGLARTADLQPGQFTFRVVVPNGVALSQALPAGALITVSLSGTTTDYVTVSAASGSTVTLSTPLANLHSMAGPLLPQVASLEFNLVVTGATTETWSLLSMNPIHPGYWGSAVNSQLITLSLPATPSATPPSDPRPADGIYNLAGGMNDDRVNDVSGPTLSINSSPTTYLNLLTPLQDVDIVSIPGNTNVNAQQALVTHCETLFNRFAVLDAAPDSSPGFPNLLAQYGQVRTPNGFAAIYFPWIQVVNPLTGATEYWPPAGHVMGIYAQTDQTYGVYKAPANVAVAGALGLQSLLTNNDQGPLNLLGINILRVFPEQSQPLVWGARTTSTDSDWQYVNIRRLFIYLEQSIEQGIRWAVFAPNNVFLWGQLKRTITEFLNRVQGDGGIISFYVRIDAALNPPATQALGQLFIEVGIQPTYPAEFIILRIGIWQGGSSVTES